MGQIEVLVVDSNSIEFPARSRILARVDRGSLVELATYEVETVTYFQNVVRVRVAFGYEFVIDRAEYDTLLDD